MADPLPEPARCWLTHAIASVHRRASGDHAHPKCGVEELSRPSIAGSGERPDQPFASAWSERANEGAGTFERQVVSR